MLHGDLDLLNPPAELEKGRHKLKRLVQVRGGRWRLVGARRVLTSGWLPVAREQPMQEREPNPPPSPPLPAQSPNSFFMDVKCQGCFNM